MKVYVVTMTYEPWNATTVDGIYSTYEKANDRVCELAESCSCMYFFDVEEYEVDT